MTVERQSKPGQLRVLFGQLKWQIYFTLNKMAYGSVKPSGEKYVLSYLPKDIILPKTKETIVLDWYKDSDFEDLFSMMKDAVDGGQTYPQDTMDKDDFEKYYLSHDAFVARNPSDQRVMGSFYVKPNFPGRSSHICNAGFLVHKDFRNRGIGEVLFREYLPIAKDLGYEGSFFNLVFATNHASIRVCRKLGFKEIGRIPNAGKMKGLGYVDALQFYYDLTTLKQDC
ncbi:n-acetyltransferase aca1 [Caerostris darwini]|uniref:N-acetyltransferase aca1 n=1 Tax=Caerostris darwini TaxID=1538125 RepID=A0AAV4WUD8_9ARAC|nr:n-acetyltransferase aca1 [Caerostris darwini]